MLPPAATPARKRRLAWIAVCVLMALAAAGTAAWLRSRTRLNILLITFDTTRADRLGAYGYSQGLTKSFDDFAQVGVLFERAYAPAPVTLPSHATMLTGLYPPEHGLRVNGDGRLPQEIPFLPEILKKNGYDTAAFIAAPVLDSKYGLDRGFDLYDDDLPRSGSLRGEPRRDGKLVVDQALHWLKQRTDRPFFCWIHLYDAHAPYDSRPGAYQRRFEQNPYDAGVAWEVDQFGRLMTFLRERGLDADSLCVVAGDHGEGLDDHLENEHGMLVYNTTLHVPFVFVGQKHCQRGVRVPETVSLVDLMPTILDLLRIPPPQHVSGRSLAAALKGQPIEPRECYAEAESPFVLNRWAPLRTVISGRWKYIHTTKPELFDLEQDPGELTNLVQSSAAEQQRLQELLEITQEKFVLATAQNLKLSEKDIGNLQALGYVAGGKRPAEDNSPSAAALPDVKDFLPYLAKYERAKHLAIEGKGAQSTDKLTTAITLLEEVVQSTPDFPLADLLLGDCLAQAGRKADAEKTYQALLSRRPDFLKAHFNLGRIYSEQGRFEEAAAQFREYLRASPDEATAHFELAETLTQLKEFDDAIASYRAVLRIAPDFAAASLQLGRLLIQLQRPDEAQVCFEEALKRDPRSLDLLAHMVMVLVQTGQNDKAIEQSKKLIALDPQSFDAHFNLGVLLAAQRKYLDAVAELRAAQRIRPNDPRPGQQIAQVEALLKTGNRGRR